MRLKMTLVRHDGTNDDIVVTADAGSSVSDVAHAIAVRDPGTWGPWSTCPAHAPCPAPRAGAVRGARARRPDR
ncbi:hypothetical protein NKG05_05850 [Oerskovia sp. M15]